MDKDFFAHFPEYLVLELNHYSGSLADVYENTVIFVWYWDIVVKDFFGGQRIRWVVTVILVGYTASQFWSVLPRLFKS